MKKILMIIGFVALCFGAEDRYDLKLLLEQKEYFKIRQELEMLPVFEDVPTFPKDAEKGKKVLLTNDYNLKSLWEYDGEAWNSWENETINVLLNKPQRLLTQDSTEQTAQGAKGGVVLKSLSANSLELLQGQINGYLKAQKIKPQNIISLQFFYVPSGVLVILAH